MKRKIEIIFYLWYQALPTFKALIDAMPHEITGVCMAYNNYIPKGCTFPIEYNYIREEDIEYINPRILFIDNWEIPVGSKKEFIQKLSKKILIVSMPHTLIHINNEHFTDFNILYYENQAIPTENFVKYNNNQIKFNTISRLPIKKKREFAYTGPFYAENFMLNNNREIFRNDIANKIQRKITDDTKIITCFSHAGSHCDIELFCGLKKLSEIDNYLVINKSVPSVDLPICINCIDSGRYNNLVSYPDVSMSPNKLRYGSDIILCGMSSTSISSLLLDINFIPVYTNLSGRWLNHIFSCKSDLPYMIKLLKNIGWLFNIKNSHLIEYIINNYYDISKSLDVEFNNIKKIFFGNYTLNNMIQKTAYLILYLLEHDSWGDSAFAVEECIQ